MIPLSQPDLNGNEIMYAKNALDSGWISSLGEYVEKAEKAWAEYCGVKYCSVVNNGTSALHLALMALGISPGDEVIVPALTFVSPAAVVKRMGAVPVFADCSEDSWCIDPEEVARLVTRKTRAVIAVDVLGHPANYTELNSICKKHGLFLIEDAAEAHGSTFKGKRVGSFGDIATFSFFANKTIGCGEGGAITTNNEELFRKCALLKNHGMDKAKPYWHDFVGDNFRMTNPTAAILLGQIERANALIANRTAVANYYRSQLSAIPGIVFRPHAKDCEIAPWIEAVQITHKCKKDRSEIISYLRTNGIDSRAIWYPLTELPPYKEDCIARGTLAPIAKQIMEQTLWLPTYSGMKKSYYEKVAQSFIASLA